jgi:hypothetical protein
MRKTVFSLLFLVPAGLLAQAPKPQRFELTPTVGYRLNSDFDAVSGDFFDASVEIEESATYGAIFDIPLGESGWKLELLANRQDSTLIVNRGLLDPTIELGDITLGTYHVGFLYQWGPGQVEPFIVFSGGLTRLEPDFPGVSGDNRLSGSFGGGVKLFFSDNIGLRLEARGYWTDLSDAEVNDRFDADEALYQGEGSAGLIIAF